MEQVFELAPASSGVRWTLIGLIGLMSIIPVMFFRIYLGVTSASATLDPQALRIQAPLYGRSIPLSELRGAEAKVIGFSKDPEFQPRLRTNGIGLPGLLVGWFKLRSGERALAYVTNRERVVYVPTQNGYALLLSVREADRLVGALGGQ